MAELFHVNQEFTVYQDFLDVISQYQQTTGYSLTTYDCRTMNTHCASRKKIPNIYPDFPFYYAYYHCPRSGTYVPKKNDDAKQRNNGTMKTGCPVILQGTVNLQRKVFRITKWISSHNHLAVEGKDTKTVDSNTQIKLVKKNQNIIQRTEVVKNKQMDNSVTEGFYVINNEGDLLEDNQLIHLWPIKNIFTELERNILD
ncbi:uncharacterized protein LOC141525342 [Cotesia typhae]|uniref:uncharacterized protein LOC141525342 n=1 Tax=Cotesia typhae TaxID=2053667 RepID=UPI003D6926B3